MKMGVPVRRVHTGDQVLDQAQRTAQDTARRFNSFPLGEGRLIDAEDNQPMRTGLSFTGGTARSIKHGLGRKAVGWFEVYGPDLVSTNHVGLRTTAHPTGVTSDTHVTVTPASTGKCFLFVF